MEISLKDVNENNFEAVNALRSGPLYSTSDDDGKSILAKAYLYRKDNSIVRVIYRGFTPIGLILQKDLYIEDEDMLICQLNHFLVATKYQHQGYGKKAIKLWLREIMASKKYDSVELYYDENGTNNAEEIFKEIIEESSK